MRWVQWAAGLGLTGLLLGCSAAGPVVETPPPLPTHFRPGPPLGAPDPIEADAPGRDYLLAMSSVLQPRWASFLEDLRLRLPPEHPLNRKDLVVELEIRLNSDGVLEAVNVAASSGAEDFDRAAVEVVSDAQPFARPPEALASDDETFRFRWWFARDRRQAGPATARVEMMRWPLSKAVPELLAADRIGEALRRVAAAGDSAGPHLRTIATAVVRRGLEARKLEAVSLVDDPQFADQIARIVDSARSVQLRQAAIEALGRVATGPEARLSRLVQA
ncbi:MAG: TonB family protein, partial [Deltaproteobacteria bacterium]|nr:TonB family protein [Deltaproteobacteria bacterium]